MTVAVGIAIGIGIEIQEIPDGFDPDSDTDFEHGAPGVMRPGSHAPGVTHAPEVTPGVYHRTLRSIDVRLRFNVTVGI